MDFCINLMLGDEAIGFLSFLGMGSFSLSRRGCRILAFLDKDLDHVGEEAIEFRISALALGDGIHFPALVRLLGSSFPDRGRTYIVVFPFPDWDWDWARRLSNFVF